jgi:hypothetical protein
MLIPFERMMKIFLLKQKTKPNITLQKITLDTEENLK